MAEMPGHSGRAGDGNAGSSRSVPQATAAWFDFGESEPAMTMEEVLRRENLLRAYRRVKGNGGSSGIDGMTVDELGGFLVQCWEALREELLAGRYRRLRYVRWRSRNRAAEAGVVWES